MNRSRINNHLLNRMVKIGDDPTPPSGWDVNI